MLEGLKETSSKCFNMMKQNAGVRSSHMHDIHEYRLTLKLKGNSKSRKTLHTQGLVSYICQCHNMQQLPEHMRSSKVKSGNSSVSTSKSVKTLSLFVFAWNLWPMASGITTKQETYTNGTMNRRNSGDRPKAEKLGPSMGYKRYMKKENKRINGFWESTRGGQKFEVWNVHAWLLAEVSSPDTALTTNASNAVCSGFLSLHLFATHVIAEWHDFPWKSESPAKQHVLMSFRMPGRRFWSSSDDADVVEAAQKCLGVSPPKLPGPVAPGPQRQGPCRATELHRLRSNFLFNFLPASSRVDSGIAANVMRAKRTGLGRFQRRKRLKSVLQRFESRDPGPSGRAFASLAWKQNEIHRVFNHGNSVAAIWQSWHIRLIQSLAAAKPALHHFQTLLHMDGECSEFQSQMVSPQQRYICI